MIIKGLDAPRGVDAIPKHGSDGQLLSHQLFPLTVFTCTVVCQQILFLNAHFLYNLFKQILWNCLPQVSYEILGARSWLGLFI